MVKKGLKEWLFWLKNLHHKEMDLGLERVRKVANDLSLLPTSCSVILVGGTNGKGSTVAGLETIYSAAGYRVGAFTSPYLLKFNEQVRIENIPASDEALSEAFELIESKRGDITLTAFEITALAAFILFKKANLDLWIIEVGLGGRLDAVNILEPAVSIITSISLDHVDILGNTREAIALEKAGICRPDKPAICGDNHPPETLLGVETRWYFQGKDFYYHKKQIGWDWNSQQQSLKDLPETRLALSNMATVLMAVENLQALLPVSEEAIRHGLSTVNLPGRIQVIPGEITWIYDVSHNPASAEWLVDYLQKTPCVGRTYAVFSMLADKDITETLKITQAAVDNWDVAPLSVPRAASEAVLKAAFLKNNMNGCFHQNLEDALFSAKEKAILGDRIVVFGSFHTVAEALKLGITL